MTSSRLLYAMCACTALAAASLLIAAEPVYDAWSWLVWGRELAHLGLDTTSGPSWKPLPVLVAAPLSLLGDAAPALWLVLVRAAWLLSLVLAFELGYHLSARHPRRLRIGAGAFAAVSLALLFDDVTMWARQAAGGMSEPLLVALVLGAVRAGLAGRTRTALVLGALAALVRPEAWLLLVLYAAWSWRAQPRARLVGATLVALVAVLWLAPDLLGSGGGGSGRARRGTGDPAEALWWAFGMPLVVAWPLALLGARARGAPRVLAAGALGWIALVAAMTLLGFPGLPRFQAPAAALVGVLGGVGLAALLGVPRPLRLRRAGPARLAAAALLVAALAATLAGLPGRVGDLPLSWRSAARISDSHARLRALVRDAGGRATLLRCGRLATSDVLVRTALAWQLRVPLSQVVSFGAPSRRSGAFVVGLQASPGLRQAMLSAGVPLGAQGEWSVRSVACPVTESSSSASSAGVAGASR
jgi:hypothetical protein